jgi:hypothetical protein
MRNLLNDLLRIGGRAVLYLALVVAAVAVLYALTY